MKEVPTYKMISQSVLIERMKINGSVARKAMRTLEDMGLIKKVVHHHGQWVYSELRHGFLAIAGTLFLTRVTLAARATASE